MFFSKAKKSSSSEVRDTMRDLQHSFKKEVKKDKNNIKDDGIAGKACCGCLNLFSQIKIPKEYEDVVSWLTSVTTHGGVNQTVIITALKLSMEFASENTLGNEVAAEILSRLIDEAVARLGLNLDMHADYAALQDYCTENKIQIPKVLQPVLDKHLTSDVVPA